MSEHLPVGIHDNIPAAVYHADPCERPSLSSSLAADLLARSPMHARLKHPRLNPGAAKFGTTDAMDFGSVVHELLLGRGDGLAVWEEDDWRGKEAAAFRKQARSDGKTPVKRPDYERAENVAEAARAQLDIMGLGYVLTEGKSEQVAIWKNGDHYARAMFDRWLPERGEIWDIKTTGKSAHPDQIARIIPAMNYDMRSEFYLMGAESLTGMPSKRGGLGYQFLFIETAAPFAVTPCYLDESFRARGRQRAMEAVRIWERCTTTGVWPGYANAAVEISAPGWVDYEIEDSEITTNQEAMR
jgi:hypothetical protein